MIATKQHFYRLYELGRTGNKLRTWRSVNDLMASGFNGTVTLRYQGAGGGGFCAYEVPTYEVADTVSAWRLKGADPALVNANESAPDSGLLLQGELMERPGGWWLRYSTAKAKMRDAMQSASIADGLTAEMMISAVADPASIQDLRDLLEAYPGAVIEFGIYDRNLGILPGRNTVIWEVRNY